MQGEQECLAQQAHQEAGRVVQDDPGHRTRPQRPRDRGVRRRRPGRTGRLAGEEAGAGALGEVRGLGLRVAREVVWDMVVVSFSDQVRPVRAR